MAAAVAVFSSCSKHDPFEEIMEVGQPLPTVTWTVGSTVATAGDSVEFKAKYYTDKDHTPDHSEVWALVSQSETSEAVLKLTGTSFAYTQTETVSDTVRTSQSIASYPHSQAVWNGREFELTAKFPTSQTLKSFQWGTLTTWDQSRFERYITSEFKEKFLDHVITSLTKDSTYYRALKTVYINYDFTADQFNSIIAKYPQLNKNGELSSLVETESGKKSDIWYAKDTGKEEDVVGKYYIDVVDGKTIYKEVPKDYENAGVKLYDVYDSAPWIFCRYDDNTGSIIQTVRSEYMPFFKDLISLIPFQDWIYSDGEYNVTYKKVYKLGVVFKVADTVGNVGYTTDDITIDLN